MIRTRWRMKVLSMRIKILLKSVVEYYFLRQFFSVFATYQKIL